MSSRQRFRETMTFGRPDRVPYFEEGIRKKVVKAWQRQGLSGRAELAKRFPSDVRERIELDLEPRAGAKKIPLNRAGLKKIRRRLDPYDRKRLPKKWKKRVKAWKDRDHVLMLYVHRGLFLTMGVGGWQRFLEVMDLLVDKPGLARKIMNTQGEFSAKLIEQVLREVHIDAAIFSEPIGGNEGPLISPGMYEDVVLRSYRPVLDVLNRYGVETIIFQTFANARILIPSIIKWGFNTLWACEVNIDAMDYRDLRKEFGRDLRLIGAIDLDALRMGKKEIKKELEEKVPPLIAQGGFVPLADGRVREDVPFENYVYYRELLKDITQKR